MSEGRRAEGRGLVVKHDEVGVRAGGAWGGQGWVRSDKLHSGVKYRLRNLHRSSSSLSQVAIYF